MAFKTKNTAERLPCEYEGATIYFHRILFARQGELIAQCTVRGETNWRQVQLYAAQDAVDGWDDQVHDADDQPLALPTGLSHEEQRQCIAVVVSAFPTELVIKIAALAFADNLETVRKNWQILFPASSSSPIDVPGENLPVATVVPITATTASDPLVTEGA